MGSDEMWDRAEASLQAALEEEGLEFEINEGDGAFYGPKIDLHMTDSIGRSWQLGTVQLDYSMPERFELAYTGADNEDHQPVMIHRALMGSFERFIGILIEHYAGEFPLWLAPAQALVLPISDRHIEYAEQVARELRDEGLRVAVDDRGESVGRKIRDGELRKVPYLLVVGDARGGFGSGGRPPPRRGRPGGRAGGRVRRARRGASRGPDVTTRWRDCPNRASLARVKTFIRHIALPALLIAALACAAVAVAAPSSGTYKGKIEYQGYDVKFKVSGGKVTKFSARMLQDCGDGFETFTIAPKGGFKIEGNSVDAKRVDTYGKSKATVILKGKFSGSKFKGSVREYDFVPGSGIVCDTLKRKFTAKK